MTDFSEKPHNETPNAQSETPTKSDSNIDTGLISNAEPQDGKDTPSHEKWVEKQKVIKSQREDRLREVMVWGLLLILSAAVICGMVGWIIGRKVSDWSNSIAPIWGIIGAAVGYLFVSDRENRSK